MTGSSQQDRHTETIAEARERIVRLETQITAMASTLAELLAQNKTMAKRMDEMADVVTSARAGTKAVVGLFALAASVGGAVSWIITHVKWSS